MALRKTAKAPRTTVAIVSVVLVVACGGSTPAPPIPPPAPAPADPSWLADAAKACVRVTSCARADNVPHLREPGACVEWWAGHPNALRACLSGAKTCAQVETCLYGDGDARAAAFCAERKGVASGCVGDRLVSCGDDDSKASTVTDCTALEATCKETKSAGGIVVRGCFSLSKCPPGGPEARCDGDAVLTCRDGNVERVVCKAGARCQERRGQNGEAAASCVKPRGVACENDCAAAGLRCIGTGLRAGCYLPNDVECDREMVPRCDGGALTFCAAGRLTKVACADVGLGACERNARSPIAACSEKVAQDRAP